jgi:ParB family chromosome partitioning protein
VSSDKRGLGRGLDSLIPTVVETEFEPKVTRGSDEVLQLSPQSISPNPHQPRQLFDESALDELAASIKQHGILQPVVVSKVGDKYQLIAGERRLRAAKLAGLKQVPAIIRSFDEQQKLELALIENLQRQDLNPVETAAAYKKLMDQFNLSYDAIGKRVGKDRSTVANIVRLLGLPLEAKRALAEGRISEGHARAILAIPEPERRLELLDSILEQGWTVRQAEQFARGSKRQAGSREAGLTEMASSNQYTQQLEQLFKTKVSVQQTAKGGRLIIQYSSADELVRIYELIKRQAG